MSTPDPPPGRAIAPVTLDDDRAWPDLNRPVEAERRADRHEPSLLLAPTTWLPMPPPKKWYRKPVTIVAAALVLLLISGGTLVLVNSLRNPSAPGTLSGISGGPSLSQSGATGTGATTTVSATGSATGAAATGSATGAAATGVATGTTTVRPTATGASSATQQPTATSTSAPHLVTIFSDPLTSNTNGWPVQTGCAFAGGGYTVSGSTTGGASCRAPVTVPNTVNITVTMKSTAASFSGAGIGFRVPTTGDDDYSFHISSTGACTATDEVTDVVFFNNTSCSAVATGANAVNTLKITQSGAQMNFYVNGTLVGSANDATLSTGGITLQVGTNTSMVFNNFVLTQLQ